VEEGIRLREVRKKRDVFGVVRGVRGVRGAKGNKDMGTRERKVVW